MDLRVIPFTELELKKLYHILREAGYDPERLARVQPSQIVYAFEWDLKGDTPSDPAQKFHAMRVSNNDASIITNISASVTEPQFYVRNVDDELGDIGNTTWVRADDPRAFSNARNPLDYIDLQVSENASEQLSTGYVPLSHWVADLQGWMPSRMDFIPGGNYSSYELAFRTHKHVTFDKLQVSLTAIQLVGL